MTIKEEKDKMRQVLSPAEFQELEMHMKNLKNFMLFSKDHKDLQLDGMPFVADTDDLDELIKVVEEFLCA